VEPLCDVFFPAPNSNPKPKPTSLKQYCDIVAPYVVKGEEPSILYDILSAKFGDGKFLTLLKMSKEYTDLVNSLPDQTQEILRSLEMSGDNKILFHPAKKTSYGHPFKDMLVNNFKQWHEWNRKSLQDKIEKLWTTNSLSQWKTLKGEKPLNWESFEIHHYTHEFAALYRPWLAALERSYGVFGESPDHDVTAQPFWRVVHGLMERELDYLFHFLPVLDHRLEKTLDFFRQYEAWLFYVYDITIPQILEEFPEERYMYEWHMLRLRYLSMPGAPLAPPPKDPLRKVY